MKRLARPLPLLFSSLLLSLSLSAPASAQANAVPGLDVRLSAMRTLEVMGRSGAFPDGINGIALETTVCNDGTVEVPWLQPMNPAHPKIAFLIAAVRDGRMIQLSGRSYVKHGFFAVNGSSCGRMCVRPSTGDPGELLGVGCSDTYATTNNGDNFYLGPPDEVDPWLGTWRRRCSLFDRGFPEVSAPENCDGRRSLTRTAAASLGPTQSRVQVRDVDLLAGGELYFQGQYVVEGQPEAARGDALGSRQFTATWDGTRWVLAATGSLVHGSVLARWAGAELASATDGDDDGRVYAALVVTGPVDGFYRYEYALHNRDHARGIGELRIPLCAGARILSKGFRDDDADPRNDWTIARTSDALVYTASGKYLPWNTIHNFWFECDAAPAEAVLELYPGSDVVRRPALAIPMRSPLALANAYAGPGCARGTPPTLFATGAPARGTLGNAGFGLASSGNEPSQPHLLFYSLAPGAQPFRGCTLWLGGVPRLASLAVSDGLGVAAHAVPIPNDLALEGRRLSFQALGRVPDRGTLFGDFQLSDGLVVRLGNLLVGCP